MKFKSDIEVQAGLVDGSNDIGTAGQLLSSTGTITNWIDQADVVAAGATRVLIACKNTSGATITKGTPVYQTGNVGATDVIEIAEADALISTGNLPAIGLLETDLINNASGHVVITGELLNITTDPIDGLTPTTGDTIYLKSGGGLTLTKPTGAGNAIQNLGLVGKVSGGSAGSITVASIMRQNDVPNLSTGKIWVGDGNTIESSTVYLDEPNGRMGIGTSSPSDRLEVYNNGGDVAVRIHEDAGTHEARLHLRRGGSDWELINNNNFTIESEGSEKFRITTTGNVGIGTTSPGEKLDVRGNIHIEEALPSIIFKRNISGLQEYSITNEGNFTIEKTTLDSGGSFIIKDENGKTPLDVSMGLLNPDIVVSGDLFVKNKTGTTTNLYVQENNGNVGIGTTSPSKKLHVAGTARVDSTFYLGTDDSCAFFRYFNSLLITNSANTNVQVGGGPGNVNNNFFIGNGYLDVNGTIRGKNYLYLEDAAGTLRTSLRVESTYATLDNGSNSFNYNAGVHKFMSGLNEKMRIDSSGNVGINTTNPLAKLHVDGGTYLREDFYVAKTGSIGTSNMIEAKPSGTPGGDAQIIIGDVNDYWGGTNSYSVWDTSNQTLIHGVNVGINIDPKNMLHLFKGNLYLESSGIRDANGSYGSAGQNLKSKGQGTVEWSWEKMTLTSVFYASSFQSGSVIYMPMGGTTSETTSNQYYNNFVAPFNGRVRQIRIKNISGSTPTATSFSSFRVYVNGSLTGNVTPTTTGGGSNGMMGVAEYSDTAATFSAGDRVQFAYVASGSTGHIYGATATFIIEYTENS